MTEHDKETPIQLIQNRLQYHWDILENVKFGSEMYKLHHEKAMEYAQAYGILTGSWTLSSALDKIYSCMEKLPDEVAEKIKELEKES